MTVLRKTIHCLEARRGAYCFGTVGKTLNEIGLNTYHCHPMHREGVSRTAIRRLEACETHSEVEMVSKLEGAVRPFCGRREG